MTFDTADIMRKAHAAARSCAEARDAGNTFYTGQTYASFFAAHLRRLWRQAKMLTPVAVAAPEGLRRDILSLEAKDRMSVEEQRDLSALRSKLAGVAA
ncbi:hypothetical protein JI664_12830 [Rhodobacter sp. NTK016B]|uniref:hypothetical protein n=1 Tax=Rhodobacter sp. NTK016B TaxID=2759676 RepID=UPI001A8D9A4A|nr:hypothetical protein [Rhodobacter sp. NTK016B]MBN8292852.1 hypothetical protein [Rhodobacter sp. NTK016B]